MGEYCSLDTLQVATLVSANNHGKKKQQDAIFSQGSGNWGIWANFILDVITNSILRAQFLQTRGPLNNKVLTSPSPNSANVGPVST